MPLLPRTNTVIKTTVNTQSIVKAQALLNIYTEQLTFETTVLITPSLIYYAIIRTDTLTKFNANINFKESSILKSVCMKLKFMKIILLFQFKKYISYVYVLFSRIQNKSVSIARTQTMYTIQNMWYIAKWSIRSINKYRNMLPKNYKLIFKRERNGKNEFVQKNKESSI